eukprot:gb/GECG01007826.1/.p1 GENE.gb/GECG01007826.1/~~gb/GECG01007826.1/.p1  ORF type:complete len:235 (+),score=26.03 gb/GECG01007826.1/:1-705(+)
MDNKNLDRKVEELKERGCNVDEECDQRFVCPISLTLMSDPVLLEDGHNYQQEEIERWLASSRTSPMTGEQLPTTHKIYNHALRGEIFTWVEQRLKEYQCGTFVGSGLQVHVRRLQEELLQLQWECQGCSHNDSRRFEDRVYDFENQYFDINTAARSVKTLIDQVYGGTSHRYAIDPMRISRKWANKISIMEGLLQGDPKCEQIEGRRILQFLRARPDTRGITIRAMLRHVTPSA